MMAGVYAAGCPAMVWRRIGASRVHADEGRDGTGGVADDRAEAEPEEGEEGQERAR